MLGLLVTALITVSASVPLRIDARGGVLVPVHVNGAGPYIFVLDTGSSRSIVSSALARELNAPVVARSEIVGSGGSEMGMVVRLGPVTVGSARVPGLLAPIVDESRLSQLGSGIRGVLGQDFLAGFNYTLDYRRARLVWEAAVACDTRDAIAARVVEGRMVVAMRDGRGETLRLVADSGAEIAVLCNFNARDDSRQPRVRLAGLTGGANGAALRSIPLLRAGSIALRHTMAAIVPRNEPAADGLLPLRVFSRVSFAAGGACIIPVT
jgi:Aspartyl protease